MRYLVGTLGVALVTGACAPAINLRVTATCRTRLAANRLADAAPGDRPDPRRVERAGESVPVVVRSIGNDRIEVALGRGGGCTLTARMTSSAGRAWRPSRSFAVEAGQRCRWDVPEEGAQLVTVNGPTPPRTERITDRPSDPQPSRVFVDVNNDTEVALYGRTPAGSELDVQCSYLAPR